MKLIHHVLDIDAAPAVAWNALTEPDGLAGWWSTRLATPNSAAVGVQIHWTFAGDFNPVMEITRLESTTSIGATTWRVSACSARPVPANPSPPPHRPEA
jgi:uncharacterized protein YndB with AHSA1/START domain